MKARDETKDRFLAAIAARLDPAAVAEAHFFQPIRQGGTESGVAVIAVKERAASSSSTAAESSAESSVLPTGRAAAAENSPAAAKTLAAAAENGIPAAESGITAAQNDARVASRLAIYTAKYRLTLKGPDRGKWEFSIHAEADAPLVTVDRVVQGVQRRSGDAEVPERLSGEEFLSLLPPSQPAVRSGV